MSIQGHNRLSDVNRLTRFVSFLQHSPLGCVLRYGLAAVAVAAALGLRKGAEAWVGPGLPTYITFYPAIMAVALLGGFVPGLVATAMADLVVAYWILPPVGFAVASPVERVGLVIFSGMGLFMSLVAKFYLSNRDKAAAFDREAVLREGRARLAAFAEATFEGIVESEAGRIVDCNEQFARMLGYTVADLKDREIASLIPPEDRERVTANILPGRDSIIEHTALRKDGTRIIVEAHGRSLSSGNARRHTAIRDITDRRRAEQALRESEHRFRLALRNAPVSVAAQDKDLRFFWAYNQRTASPADILGKTDAELFAPEDVPRLRDLKRKVMETGTELSEQLWITSNGQRVFLDLFVEPLHNDAGEITGVGLAAVDLTPAKLAEASLHAKEERLRLALDAARLATWDWDIASGNIVWNGQHFRLMGYKPGEIQPSYQCWADRVHPDDIAGAEAKIQKSMEDGGDYINHFRTLWPDGTVRYLEALGHFERDDAGKALRCYGVMLDVTERKRAEEVLRLSHNQLELRVQERTAELAELAEKLRALAVELTQTEQRERRRLAQILHDSLQQSLVAALMKVGLLRRRIQDPKLDSTIGQLDDLLNDAISESRSLAIQLSPPALYNRGLAAGLGWLAEQTHQRFDLAVEVQADPAAEPAEENTRIFLFQAVSELLLNAAKHAQAHRVLVRVNRLVMERPGARSGVGNSSASLPQEQVCIEVSDDGVGFDPAQIGGKTGGGFGMFSIRQRLEVIGGRFEVWSRPGDGTRVTILAPLGKAAET